VVTGYDQFTSTTAGAALNARVAPAAGRGRRRARRRTSCSPTTSPASRSSGRRSGDTGPRWAILGSTNYTDTQVDVSINRAPRPAAPGAYSSRASSRGGRQQQLSPRGRLRKRGPALTGRHLDRHSAGRRVRHRYSDRARDSAARSRPASPASTTTTRRRAPVPLLRRLHRSAPPPPSRSRSTAAGTCRSATTTCSGRTPPARTRAGRSPTAAPVPRPGRHVARAREGAPQRHRIHRRRPGDRRDADPGRLDAPRAGGAALMPTPRSTCSSRSPTATAPATSWTPTSPPLRPAEPQLQHEDRGGLQQREASSPAGSTRTTRTSASATRSSSPGGRHDRVRGVHQRDAPGPRGPAHDQRDRHGVDGAREGPQVPGGRSSTGTPASGARCPRERAPARRGGDRHRRLLGRQRPGRADRALPNQALGAQTIAQAWYIAPPGVTIAKVGYRGKTTSLPGRVRHRRSFTATATRAAPPNTRDARHTLRLARHDAHAGTSCTRPTATGPPRPPRPARA
jgi:hypothetical protein